MTTDVQPRSERRWPPWLSAVAQVTAVIGTAVCLLLVVGVLVGRGWAIDRVGEVSAAIDAGLSRGAPLLETANARVAETSARASSVAETADAVAASPASALVRSLEGEVASTSERFLTLRTAYADVREALASALARLNTIATLAPGISIPERLTETLAAVDASLRTIDARLAELRSARPASGPVSDWAGQIAGAAGRIETTLGDVSARLDTAEARLANVRAEVAATSNTISTAINVVAILAILVLLYLVLLHWVLFRTARASGRGGDG